MEKQTVFIAYGTSSILREYIMHLARQPSQYNIFFTAESAENGNNLLQEMSHFDVSCDYEVVAARSLSNTASAVVKCTETFGGIDVLLFGGWQPLKAEPFLDIEVDTFSLYADTLKDFFQLCKCAVPYMLGRNGASILLPLDESESLDLVSSLYKGAGLAMTKNMKREFECYGVDVKTVHVCGKELSETA